MVSTSVGIPPRKFVIHYSVAANISQVIGDLAADEQDGDYSLEIKEFSPKAFELFMRYCYCGSMGRTAESTRIAEAYLLGDYLYASRFKQAMLDTAIRKNMVIELVSFVLEHTKRGEPRRNNLLDWFTNEVRDGKYHITEESDQLKPYMAELYGVLLSMSRKRTYLNDEDDDAGRKRNCAGLCGLDEDGGVLGLLTKHISQTIDECPMITPVSPISGSPSSTDWVLSHSVAEARLLVTTFPIESNIAAIDTMAVSRDPRPYRPSKCKSVANHSLRHSQMSASSDNIRKDESEDVPLTPNQPNPHLHNGSSTDTPEFEKPRRNSNVKCRCCLESFPTEQALFTHVARTHPNIQRSTSGRPLWDQADTIEDGRPIAGATQQLMCRFCGITFKDFGALRAHVKREKHQL